LSGTGHIHVVAGVVIDAAGRILLAQRPQGRHLAGGWEFPGGKLDPGETRLGCLRRELDEELGIAVEAAHPLIRVRHRYPERAVLLDVWVVSRYRGVPTGRDGQQLRWCRVSALPRAELLPADRPIVAALMLPERITARATRTYEIVRAGDFRRARSARSRRLHGAHCGGPAEARAAAAAGADFLVLKRAITARALAALCDRVNVPVYARGIAPRAAREAGAAGVSAMRAAKRGGSP